MAWTNLAKPTGDTWTKLAKPDGGSTTTTIHKGLFTGILGLTHSSTQTSVSGGATFTKIAKPSSGTWNKLSKPV